MGTKWQSEIVTPAEFLGHEVGADCKLADWPQIVEYFWALSRGSDRIGVTEIGETTEGNPLLMVTIAAPETLKNLDHYREVQARLADPRSIKSESEAEALIAEGKSVIMVTCSVHATEVGATQMSMLLAHHLATSSDETVQRILDNVIFLLVPSLNPDGLRLVKKWYDSTLGTWYEGVNQPFLYHKYVGHDNNRDWFMFTQRETQLIVEHGHNAWHPQVVYDLHQMGPRGPRLFVPPYVDPIDSNVDPILQTEIAMMGTAMFSELTGQGKAGVAVYCIYDAYSPSRAYQHYHGAIRILSEAASCRIASPIEVKPEEITVARGIDPRLQTWNNPLPWRGGSWSLRDIVDYDYAAVMAALGNMARYRDIWLRNFYAISKNAVEGPKKPFAYVIPQRQRDSITAHELLEVMGTAMVEVHEADAEFTADGVRYPAGTRVIFTAQPYGAFAKTMLEVQRYPDLRMYPGGPPKAPYDATAHGLPLQMGVQVVEVQTVFEASLQLVGHLEPPQGKVVPSRPGRASVYLLDAQSNASFRVANRLLAAGAKVSRARQAFSARGRRYEPGTYLAEGEDIGSHVRELAANQGLEFVALTGAPSTPWAQVRAPRVGLYRSWVPTAEEGWSRWIFEQYELHYGILTDADIRQGGLRDTHDAIVLPHQPAQRLLEGNSATEYPPPYVGGLGDLGSENLREFVEEGGTLIAWDGAAEYAIKNLDLPATNVLEGVPESEFYAPGSFFRILLDTSHPIAYGMPHRASVMFQGSPAFDVREGMVVGKYPPSNPLLSGWVLGNERLHGRAALAEIPIGLGRVILIGFKVHFRAQARGTYRLLFNSILYSTLS